MSNRIHDVYFDTLGGALDAAYGAAVESGAELDITEWTRFVAEFGPVAYGTTVSKSVLLFRWKGKLSYRYALTVVIYRMPSGRYEMTSYCA
jgi:hypothetical protein